MAQNVPLQTGIMSAEVDSSPWFYARFKVATLPLETEIIGNRLFLRTSMQL
jgi:hypothetical protein